MRGRSDNKLPLIINSNLLYQKINKKDQRAEPISVHVECLSLKRKLENACRTEAGDYDFFPLKIRTFEMITSTVKKKWQLWL